MSILRFLFQTVCAFLQIKIENILNRIINLFRCGTWGAGLVKNLSVGICDGAPSTVHSSLSLSFSFHMFMFFFFFATYFFHFQLWCHFLTILFIFSFVFDFNGLISMF